ncbi:DNA topoisomerase II [Schizosaccharomyces pombe]|uniref:DNA topoisomerase 2 n=1 Tax=Schizosaccharomyces pombe (strain 972 / ATCC 24843) TaxID=284812 RepID=TOP2_SCHPO|nr:DNA topoisomerase II [Schizosaccharomyces pombe]P08096.2 RecName: Full=DNA topoisomerase 2; AltName: Full=DNA topoisomerase II [Schizosaccharomyces pombe 972h-]CAA20107.1 DNA topoisomerase II [Schizosaccharomyces pombe]|eukprot:NP_595805.1 DNA topoisomerase II [Schizosaccharomyces pombe]
MSIDADFSDYEDEASGDENVLPNTTTKRKASTTSSKSRAKKASTPDLRQTSLTSMTASEQIPLVTNNGNGNSNVSTQYQRLTPREHVLRRPDTYIGSIEPTTSEMWVFDSEKNKLDYKAVTYVPGLYKIFDEIIVNAADNKVRDPNMNTLKVTLDPEANVISIYNNGKGIPIEIHDKEKIYIPELIFGNLLTSSNYDDNQKKVTGGRNGYGAKLCNIFSTEFVVETADKERMKKYKQTWYDNMSRKSEPVITSLKKPDEYTKITFKPDLAKFGMDKIDDDMVSIIKRRIYDMAGTVRETKVYLNNERISISGFKKYVEMYLASDTKPDEEPPRVIYEHVNDRWDVAFAVSDGQFKQVSFVNNISTIRGGTHVNYVANKIVDAIDEVVKKENKKAPVKAFQIKNYVQVFVNCQIENPSFDSQTKETLTTKVSAFGSQCTLSDKFLKAIKKSSVVEEVLKFATAKADQQLSKGDGGLRSRITGLTKLEDANKAGTKESHKCVLILTEGDSAKSLAVSGLSVVGRDYYGVFPLRGKLLNVREASHSQILNNKEIQAIKKIMGFTHKKTYTDVKGLRYGHLMIMTDQDHDGSHIKGLIINYLESSYPSLLQIPGFLIQFITPIIKCTRGNQVQAFYTLPEYEYWKEANNNGRGWKIKYYKGLGTSDHDDMKSYFSDLDRHMKYFHAMQEKDAELIEMAFAKKKADVRKEWLRTYRPGIYMDYTQPQIPIDDFINRELIQFSMADNIRSIPSVVDGLKPGQRKVVYYCFKRNLVHETKVSRLAGYVASETAYHHGEVSMEQTIVNLAQNFVGSNNINLLMPNGQFGTRSEGGKNASASRYLNTALSPLARVLFNSNDDQLLNYQNDEGQWIEPEYYVPILPMVLVNGAEGIGTGWSTFIPNYNPKDITANLRHMLNGEPLEIMTPWYRGFRGSITKVAPDRYKISGIINQIGENKVEITELPIRFWTQDMKEYLEAGLVGTEKIRKFIVDYESHHGEGNVHFNVTLTEAGMKEALNESLEVKFKLSRTQATSNMIAFDASGRIKKYDSVEDILTEFYEVRLRTYQRRKEHMVNELEKRFDRFSNQARFIHMIIEGELVVSKKKKKDLIVELKEKKFQPISKPKKGHLVDLEVENALAEEEQSGDVSQDEDSDAYNYLLSMPLWSLTYERYVELLKKKDEVMAELDALIKKTPKELWLHDLDAFEHAWNKVMDDIQREMLEEEQSSRDFVNRTKKKPRGKSTGTRKPRAIAGSSSSTAVKKEASSESKPSTTNRKQQTLLEFAASKEPEKSSDINIVKTEDNSHGLSVEENRISKSPGLDSSDSGKSRKRSQSVDSEDAGSKKPVKKIAASASGRGRKTNKPVATTIFSSDDEDDLLPSSLKPSTITSTKASAKNKGKKASSVKKQSPEDDDDDFIIPGSSSTPKASSTNAEPPEDSDSPIRKRPTRRAAATVKTPIYVDPSFDSMDEPSMQDDSFIVDNDEDVDDYDESD